MAKKSKNRPNRAARPDPAESAPAATPPKARPRSDTLLHGDAGVSTEPKSLVGQDANLRTLGRYQVLGELGRGGMGAVYLADDTILKRKVALKIPQFEPSKAEQMQVRFQREAQMAAQLTHPNICQVYDVGVIDGQYVMAMEYVTGKTLAAYTKPDKLLSDRQAVTQIRKVALAVEAAHQKGMIHRDLKPGNIMLCRPDPTRKTIEPKVMDFGLAKSFEAKTTELTKSGMIVGTPCYMSKEQWSARDVQLGPQCDVYSLGVILYELLTGKLPFDVHPEEPPTTWFVKLVTQSPIKLSDRKPDVDAALESIVMKAIAVDPEDRYASMMELAAALKDWLKGKTVSGQTQLGEELGELNLNLKPVIQSGGRSRKPPESKLAIAAFGSVGAFVLLGIILTIRKPDGSTQTVTTNGESLTVTTSDGDVITVSELAAANDLSGVTNSSRDISTTRTVPVQVPEDAVSFQDKRYKLFPERLTWHEARRKCEELGGKLAEIRSQEENDFLTSLGAGQGVDGIWLGGNDEEQHHEWVWSDGVALTYTNWAPNQPNNYGGAEHYAMLIQDAGAGKLKNETSNGSWWDQPAVSGLGLPNGWKTGYVCQWEDAGTGSTADDQGATTENSSQSDVGGVEKLRRTLLDHSWHYRDSLYPHGDMCTFRRDGTWHKWRWNYWVVGPREIRIHFDRKNKNAETGIQFRFNDDLTQFTGKFKDPKGKAHVIRGTRK